MPLAIAAIGLAFIAAAFFALAIDKSPASAGTDATVYLNNSQFCGSAGANCGQPYSIQINPGDNVQWLDGESGLSHSVTECTGNGAGCPAPGGFNSGIQGDPAGPYLTRTFADEGAYFDRCQVHGNSMRGVITVGNPATPSPTPNPTPSPTESPTPTAGPSSTPGPPGRSDVTCDGETNGEDVLALLFHRSEDSGVAGCLPIGTPEGAVSKGDLDCDGSIGAADALVALRVWADLPLDGVLPGTCPAP